MPWAHWTRYGRWSANTFDYHDQHPEFVRLVMNENILHGANVAAIDRLKERNRLVIETIQTILNRGVAEGAFQAGYDPRLASASGIDVN